MSQSTSKEIDVNPKLSSSSDIMHSALEMTLEKFSSNIKFSSIKKKYRAIYKADPDGLKSNFDQLKMQFCRNVREDLKNCTTKSGIVNLLQSLEKINGNKSAISWRPSGNPEEDVRDHLYAYKVDHKEKLKDLLSNIQADNEELTTEVEVNHSEILQLKETNKELYENFSTIIDSYTGSNFQNFEAKAAESYKELKSERDKAKNKNTESPRSIRKLRDRDTAKNMESPQSVKKRRFDRDT